MTLLGADPAKWPALEWRQLDYLPLWLPYLFSVLMFCGFLLFTRREDQRREERLLQSLQTRRADTAGVEGGPGISAPVRVAGGQLESPRVQTHTEVLGGGARAPPSVAAWITAAVLGNRRGSRLLPHCRLRAELSRTQPSRPRGGWR